MRDYKILLVDDDSLILKTLGPALADEGYQLATADSGTEALKRIQAGHFDLVITDLVMDVVDGIDVLQKAKEKNPDCMVIILTGYGNLHSAVEALRLEADDYLLKPCELSELFYRVSMCLEKLELRRKIKLYEDILPVCAGCSKIRDDSGKEHGTGEWMSIEAYLHNVGRMDISSGLCPVCYEKELAKVEEI